MNSLLCDSNALTTSFLGYLIAMKKQQVCAFIGIQMFWKTLAHFVHPTHFFIIFCSHNRKFITMCALQIFTASFNIKTQGTIDKVYYERYRILLFIVTNGANVTRRK